MLPDARLPSPSALTSLRAMTPPGSTPDRIDLIVRALRRHRARIARKLEAQRGDLAEAERAPEFRKIGETLLSYLHHVPPRAESVTLPDPADPSRNLEIALEPRLKPQDNAQRYFKRAAKGERGLKVIPARIAAVESELAALDALLERAGRDESMAPSPEGADVAPTPSDPAFERDLEAALRKLPATARRDVPEAAPGSARGGRTPHAPAPPRRPEVPARLLPRRLKTTEGWDVLIGRSNEGNDHVTHALARPEDYWFHVHGAAGSHVVLRRGKGKNEPSKRTLEEVAAWAAFYSQARTAGKVPVIYTRKKYVRRPRKGPPGLALCEREKTLIVRPVEPPRDAMPDES